MVSDLNNFLISIQCIYTETETILSFDFRAKITLFVGHE